MFKIGQNQSFKYPVTVNTVIDGGRIHSQTFSVTFRRLTVTEVTDWQTRVSESARSTPEDFAKTARELAHDVVEGWDDVRDPSGDEALFSSNALDQMLDIHPVPFSISQAWLDAVNGGAKRKN